MMLLLSEQRGPRVLCALCSYLALSLVPVYAAQAQDGASEEPDDPITEARAEMGFSPGVLGELVRMGPEGIPALLEEVASEKHMSGESVFEELVVHIGAPAISPLVAGLKNDDAMIRRTAASLLYGMAALANEYATGSEYLANLKSSLKEKSVVDALIGALNDRNVLVRLQAAETLVYIAPDSPDALAALRGALGPDSPEKLNDAERAIRERLAREPNTEYPEKGMRTFLMLGVLPELRLQSIPDLAAALEHSDSRVRNRAIRTLWHIGPNAKQPKEALLRALSDEDAEVRELAAVVIGELRLGGPDSAAIFRRMLADKSETPRLRSTAAYGLAKYPHANDDETISALIEALRDESRIVRTSAVVSLGKVGLSIDRVIQALQEVAANDDNSWVRRAATKELGEIGMAPQTDVARLIEALETEELMVKAEVALALGKMGPAAADAVPLLAAALSESLPPALRLNAAKALGQIGPEAKDAVPALLRIVKKERGYQQELRRRAVVALGQIGPPAVEAVPVLIEVLTEDDEAPVRAFAESALGKSGENAAEAVPRHQARVFIDTHKRLRVGAAWALGRIGPGAKAAVPALEASANDEHDLIRSNARDALERIGQPNPPAQREVKSAGQE